MPKEAGNVKNDWRKAYSSWLVPSPVGGADLWCRICKVSVKPKNYNAELHTKTDKHKRNSRAIEAVKQVASYSSFRPERMKIFDIKWSVGIACHSAIRSTDHLVELMSEASGKNDFLRDMQLHRTKCTGILTNVVFPSLQENILNDIRNVPFSLIIDESTDVSVMKHLCLCVRYFKPDISSIATKFLCLLPVTSTTAADLFLTIKTFFDENRVPMTNIAGLGTDGASNLCGCNNSVYTRIKELSPKCVLVKCICHSLSLSAKYAFEELPSNLSFLLSGIANWFKYSSQRRNDYDSLFKTINANLPDLNPATFVSPCDTRWLVTGKVIHAIVTQWHELHAYFTCSAQTNIRNYTSRLLLQMLDDNSNYLYLIFALPLVNEFERVNSLFQHSNADQCTLFEDMNIFSMSLRARICKERYVESYESVTDLQLRHINNVEFGAKFLHELQNSPISMEASNVIKDRCFRFLSTAVNEVTKRLPEKFEFYRILRYFHPSIYLSQTKHVRFAKLDLQHFNFSDYNISEIEKQYMSIRIIDWTVRVQTSVLESQTEFWCHIYGVQNAAKQYPFRKLANLVLTNLSLPISNAFVERVFIVRYL